MHKNITRAGVVALVAPFALAAGVAPASADPGEPNANAKVNANANSAAAITIDGCELTSDKEISYIAYLQDGVVLEKDESIGMSSYDLSDAVVEDGTFTSVRVKAGTTVKTFTAPGCDVTTGTGTVQDEDQGDDDGTQSGDGDTENTTDDDNGQEEPDGQAGGSTGSTEDNPGNSGTAITLEGCVVVSGKDISYIAFFLDGEPVLKDEGIGGEEFELSTVNLDFDEIEVKAGTEIEVFAVDGNCEGTQDGGVTTGDENDGEATDGSDNDGTDGGVAGNENRGGNDRDNDRDNDRGNDRGGDDRDNQRGNGDVRGEQAMNAGGNAGTPEVLGVEDTVAVPTEVAAGVSGTEALPQTGVEDKLVLFGAIGLGLLALGGAAMVIRRRLGSGL